MAFCSKSAVRQTQAVPVGSTAGAAQSNQSGSWRYATDDSAAVVEAANYFLPLFAKGLQKGDIIDAVAAVSGTPVRKAYVVTGASATSVAIAMAATAPG